MRARGAGNRSVITKENGVERDRLGQRHTNDGLDEYLARRARITADSFHSLGTHEPHADGGGDAAKGALNGFDVTSDGDFSDYVNHVYAGCWLVSRRPRIIGTVPPGKG